MRPLSFYLDAERAGNMAINAAKRLPLDREFSACLPTASEILAEVRHFAVCWADNEENLANKSIDPLRAAIVKAKLADRLIQFCKPETKE